MAADAVGSPLFQPSQFVTGDTQYTDAYQRGSFWGAVSTTSPDYHVLLGEPLIVSTQTVHVPAPDGLTTFNAQAQRRFGLIDAAWFSHRIKQLVGSLHVAPTTVVMFLAEDAFVSNQPPANCLQGPNCLTFSGFHDSQVNGDNEPNNQPAQSVNTFIYASYDDFGNEVPPGVDPGLMGLSHEVLEWMNDPLFLGVHQDNPFTNQTLAADAPNWTSPFDPQCSPTYEVADPVAPLGIGVPTPGGPLYVLSDAAFFSWFAREQPSTAIGGLYDIAGALTGPSTPC
jgi:hypothetical protein